MVAVVVICLLMFHSSYMPNLSLYGTCLNTNALLFASLWLSYYLVTHSPTHTLPLTHAHTLSSSPTHTHTLSLSLSHTHTISLSLTHSQETIQGAINTQMIKSTDEIVSIYYRRLEHGYPTPSLDRDNVLAEALPMLRKQVRDHWFLFVLFMPLACLFSLTHGYSVSCTLVSLNISFAHTQKISSCPPYLSSPLIISSILIFFISFIPSSSFISNVTKFF